MDREGLDVAGRKPAEELVQLRRPLLPYFLRRRALERVRRPADSAQVQPAHQRCGREDLLDLRQQLVESDDQLVVAEGLVQPR